MKQVQRICCVWRYVSSRLQPVKIRVPRANVVGWGETSEPFGLKNCLIWGSDAAILHGVLRVIVGSDERYKQQLYGQFEKIQREMDEQATKVVA